MEDKYFNERVLEQFREVLKVPSEIVTDESDDKRLISYQAQFYSTHEYLLRVASFPAFCIQYHYGVVRLDSGV
jgi:hypothetical protein